MRISIKYLVLLCFLLIGGSVAAQVRFDADFECGNLGPVSQTRSPKVRNGVKHYYYYVGGHNDPDNPVDIDLRANGNWYYFRITGAAKKYFHLSMPDNFVAGASWSYDGVQWQHLTAAEADQHSINKYFKRDTVYIALYKPYTYSYLQERLLDWTAKPYVSLDTIGFSHERRPLQMMHITDPDVPSEQKARIWMHGRAHPSETPGSYLLDGFVDYLTSDTPEGEALRRQIDAYILPFSNPDGVANGLSRSNILGVNQEINFARPEDSTVVEVRAIKAMFEKLTQDRPLDFMLNSHSQLAGCASFWMHRSDSTSRTYLRKQWTFTGLVSSHNPYIKPREMCFSDGGVRYAEGWMWNHFADSTLAITIETPYIWYHYDRSSPVTSKAWRSILACPCPEGMWLKPRQTRESSGHYFRATNTLSLAAMPGKLFAKGQLWNMPWIPFLRADIKSIASKQGTASKRQKILICVGRGALGLSPVPTAGCYWNHSPRRKAAHSTTPGRQLTPGCWPMPFCLWASNFSYSIISLYDSYQESLAAIMKSIAVSRNSLTSTLEPRYVWAEMLILPLSSM